jgi:hypothetical protein
MATKSQQGNVSESAREKMISSSITLMVLRVAAPETK